MGESAMGGLLEWVFFEKLACFEYSRNIRLCPGSHNCPGRSQRGPLTPGQRHDLFVTAALSDGAKLWDLRLAGDVCVQKFDSSVSGRHL